MNTSEINLGSLLVSQKEASLKHFEATTKEKFLELFIEKGKSIGMHSLHDNETIIFHENRFEHAFYTSSDFKRFPDRKDIFATERARRIFWIAPVISGRVKKSDCWRVNGRIPDSRLYAVWGPYYVVWMEPRNDGQWRFSSAYDVKPDYLRNLVRNGTKVWSYQ